MNMNRDELVINLVEKLGITTEEQFAQINAILNDIILGIELRHGEEILVENLVQGNIHCIISEVCRRYCYG